MLFFCACTHAEEIVDRISVRITAFHFPPLSHVGKNGRVSGKSVETVRALCLDAKLDCTFQIHPVARAYSSIEKGTVDILMTADLPRFSHCCVFTDWAYEFGTGIFAAESMQDIPSNSNSLKGKNIIIIREWQTPYFAFPDLDELIAEKQVGVVRTNSVVSSIKMHQRKRAPLLWGSRVFDWYYEKLGISMEGLNYKELTSTPSGMWVSERNPQQKEIVRRLNLANRLLHVSGAIDASEFLKPELMNAVYEDAPNPL